MLDRRRPSLRPRAILCGPFPFRSFPRPAIGRCSPRRAGRRRRRSPPRRRRAADGGRQTRRRRRRSLWLEPLSARTVELRFSSTKTPRWRQGCGRATARLDGHCARSIRVPRFGGERPHGDARSARTHRAGGRGGRGAAPGFRAAATRARAAAAKKGQVPTQQFRWALNPTSVNQTTPLQIDGVMAAGAGARVMKEIQILRKEIQIFRNEIQAEVEQNPNPAERNPNSDH